MALHCTGDKPLPQPVLMEFFNTICLASQGHSESNYTWELIQYKDAILPV